MSIRPEMQIISDVVRADHRRIYERAGAPGADDMLAAIRAERLSCTNAYEGHDGMWRVYLRYRSNRILAESGFGADLPEALFHALRIARDNGFRDRDKPSKEQTPVPKAAVPSDLDDLLGGSSTTDDLDFLG